MSDANIATIQRVYEAFGRGDVPAHAAPAIMRTTEDKVVLARHCLDFLMQLTPSIAATRQPARRAPS